MIAPPDAVYLADTSALTQMRHRAVSQTLGPLIAEGKVATCGMVDLEIFFTARNLPDLLVLRSDRQAAFTQLPMSQAHFDRAAEVMALLAGARKHRSAKVPDLLIAAVAELAGLVLLHYDADFEHIAALTGQATQWVVPRGTV